MRYAMCIQVPEEARKGALLELELQVVVLPTVGAESKLPIFSILLYLLSHLSRLK